MRKIVFVIAILISLESTSQIDFTGGAMIGITATQMSGGGLAGWDKLGLVGGGWIHMDFNGNFGTWLGMHYTAKGSMKQADPDNGDYNEFAFDLEYIDVPVLATYTTGKFRFGVGPAVGVLINQTIDYNGEKYEPTPAFKTLDISGNASVWWLATNHSSLEFRGSTSIIPIRPAPAVVNPASFYEQGNYNQGLLFAWHYRF